jgi:hypothetical protein
MPNSAVNALRRCPARTSSMIAIFTPSHAPGVVAARRSNASGVTSSRVRRRGDRWLQSDHPGMDKARINARHSTRSIMSRYLVRPY